MNKSEPNYRLDQELAINNIELTAWLKERLGVQDRNIAYAYAKNRCKVFEIGVSELLLADPEQSSLDELVEFARSKRLKRIKLSPAELDQSTSPNPSWKLLTTNIGEVRKWHKEREKSFKQGRGKAISKKTSALVWHDAGGRCMYRGCAENLGRTPLSTKAAGIAYLAHIIASDPDGPRGCAESNDLSDEPENIMLMCDAHHRLVDRIDEAGHSSKLLEAMRYEHTQQINFLLNSLKFPQAQIITLFSDLAQISTFLSERMMKDALLSCGLSPMTNIEHAIRRTQRDDRSRPGFWENFLYEHENDIRDFIRQTSNQPSQNTKLTPDVLAIFPLHLVPVLFLAGRILGEARSIEVFQYDRNRKTCIWEEASKLKSEKSIFIEGVPDESCDEVVLSLELTAKIDEKDLPDNIYSGIFEKDMPWIRISHELPSNDSIKSKEDLDQFTSIARQAIRLIHDQLRVKKVHLIGVSPASVLLRFGQLLQAGHHPSYQLYDRPDWEHKFTPAFSIDGTHIKANSSNKEEPFSISLR